MLVALKLAHALNNKSDMHHRYNIIIQGGECSVNVRGLRLQRRTYLQESIMAVHLYIIGVSDNCIKQSMIKNEKLNRL